MKGNCGECERRWFCDINPDECDAWPDPVPQTNADHIRSMTDEELLTVINWHSDCPSNKSAFTCDCVGTCEECWVDWLKQPYGGDT